MRPRPREPKLRWAVEVEAVDGWTILARFANEVDAWEYGANQIHARVYHDMEFRGERRGRAWYKDRSEAKGGP